MPVLGGSPHRLTDVTGEDALEMPGGDLLVPRATELVRVARGSPRKFAVVDGPPYWLRLSPDDGFGANPAVYRVRVADRKLERSLT